MFCIRIAGVVIKIQNQYTLIHDQCRDYCIPMQDTELVVSASEEEMLREQNGNESIPLAYCESLCIYRRICNELLKFDAFLMHAAVIAVDSYAYAFAAPSGTGKSTHIRLWRKLLGERVEIVNGDKPIFRFFGDTLYACGTPWCGKEGWQKNIRRPLKALCFLERAEENSIRRLAPEEISTRIFHQLLIPDNEEYADLFFNLIEKMLSGIDVYLLRCNMELDAAKIAFDEMGK